MASNPTNGSQLLVVSNTAGITVIDPSTPLKRLNYFDGKFLRASDFDVEQGYLRELVALSNQGLGPGVVYGYDTTLGSGDTVQIGPGLAIDPSGHVLLLQSTVSQSIQALIDATKKTAAQASASSTATGSGTFSDCIQVAAPPPTAVVPVSDIYVIAICSAEALCGQQDVYGVMCQDACVTSTDRPYRLDGIVVRAIPLQLVTPFPTSKAVAIDANLYLRSKVAHSWFADEVLKHPNAISRAGLLSSVWCVGAGYDSACCEVPLAVVARAGATTAFLDAWIVRRERMDAPAKRYWQWKMRMRPWDVFLAQILQFQCQLADVLSGIVVPGSRAVDPCAPAHKAINEAAQFIAQVRSGLASYRSLTTNATLAERPALLSLSLTQISDLQDRLQTVLKSALTPAQPKDRVLIRGGIIELPSAGYLPVVTGSSVSVNDQVRALLGEGLDLRFCITTADYIAHAVEEAQHMDRISLTQGIDDPTNKPHVDILVPDGKVASTSVTPTAGVYDASLAFSAQQTGGLVYKGAAREQALDTGGTALYMAAAGLSQAVIGKFQRVAKAIVDPTARTKATTVTGNLDTSAYIKKTGTLGTKADTMVSSAGLLARTYISAYQAGTIASLGKAAAAAETVDGLWLNAGIDKQVKSLGASGQTPVNVRIVLGTKPATPVAIDLTFHGTLSITTVSTTSTDPNVTLTAGGTLNGILAFGLLEEDQKQEKTVGYLISERFNWPVTFTYSGTESSGSVQFDLTLDQKAGTGLRITKSYLGSVQITYRIALVLTPAAGGGSTAVPLGELLLVADADVVNATNANHQYADSGLDLVQAALIVSEPSLKANADALLFPALPPATTELVIQAVRDWVMFTKRREKQCQVETPPPAPVPARRYRVINYTAQSADEAQRDLVTFTQLLKDPANLAKAIQTLLAQQDQQQRIKLVVTYAGGSATATSDLTAAEADWKTFNPGAAIYFAAIGALGESDINLQLGRLKTFEAAISADSKEIKGAIEDTIIPYPQDAVPDDADGIMLFVTVAASEPQHVYAANTELFKEIQSLAGSSTATAAQWTRILGQATDLGLATYTVMASGAVTVDDAAVTSAFQSKLPSTTILQSLVLSRKGDATADYANRASAAGQIVKDIVSTAATPKPQTIAGTWPLGDAPSMLVLQVTAIVQ